MNKDIDIEKIKKVTRETMQCFIRSFQECFIENTSNGISKHEFISYNQCLMNFIAEAVLQLISDDIDQSIKKEILMNFVNILSSTIEQSYKSD